MGRRRTRNTSGGGRASEASGRTASTAAPKPPKRRRVDSSTDDSRSERRTRLGEGIEGRINVVSDETFRENNRALQEHKNKKDASQLKPVGVELHADKNRKAHRTDDYENGSLIVRRGQDFEISLTFDRQFDSRQDEIILQFTTGPRPQQSKKSLVRVALEDQLTPSHWGMKITKSSAKNVQLSVMSSADAIVGKYTLFVETKTKTEDKKLNFRMEYSDPIYILFNAWCKEDAVYMAEDDQRKEYVLNDHGRIWVGSSRSFSGIPWNFGQFEEVSLKTSLYLLDKAGVAAHTRTNPVQVTRVISQMANHNDSDGGILFGRWTETYPEDSTPPTAWSGSVAICEQFPTNHEPVRFGQCWVFSGLVTTLLRALGIPTRSVTNFESAHDNDSSMTIDYHYDEEGKPMFDLNDSVWNFHVWNESYFTRQDLPKGYDGWQAHDATPQETSEGIYRCGPCPVQAVKKGEVYLPYDAKFVFAEVNGDKVWWEVDNEGEMKRIGGIDRYSIGKYISTKAVGSNERDDLTYNYKFPEGTPEERNAVRLANRYSSRKDEDIYGPPKATEVTFNAEVNEKVKIGDDFLVKLSMKNTSKVVRNVKVTITAKSAFYTGITEKDLKQTIEQVKLKGGEEKSVAVHLTAADYLTRMAADNCVRVFIKSKVTETGQSFATMETVEFQKPELEAYFSSEEDIKVGEEFEMTFYFTNSLPVQLTKGVFHVEGSGMHTDKKEYALKRPVKPGEEASATVKLTSRKKGLRYVAANFQSKQLSGVRGEFEVVTK